MPELGASLRRLRRTRGLTLDQLAVCSGVDRGGISRIEMGHVSPRLETLERLCAALEVGIGELLAGLDKGGAGVLPNAALEPNWTVPAYFWQGLMGVMDRFDGLFRGSRELIFVLGADGAIRFASPACEAVLGRPSATLVGRSLQALAHPQDQARLHNLLADPPAANGWRDLELRLQHPSGAWLPLAARFSNHLDNPAVRALVLNAVDIEGLEGPRKLPE